jgi:hypothetical protein
MPFTPLHLGPGIALKAGLGDRISLLAFGLAQVAMDLEPLVGLLSGAPILHGSTHTYLAALFIGLAVAFITPPLGRPILRRWNRELTYYRLDWLVRPVSIARGPVMLGALSGTFSHIALDSLMHADMQPLAPWSSANDWLGMMPMSTLFGGCVLSGVLGAIAWLIRGWFERPGGRHV